MSVKITMITHDPSEMPQATNHAALAWLFGLLDTEIHPRMEPAEYNLQRTAALLRLLGDPQRGYPSVIIAGTKGKGSTAAMLESMLRAGGRRVGLYTSPHLHEYRERIQIDRQPIPTAALAAHARALQSAAAQLPHELGALSLYEAATALALRYFAHAPVDMAVLEIGLGGRLDAVNVVTPRVAAIASISYDHMRVLGATLTEIAREKAGIIKPGVPVVSVPQHPDAAAVISHTAHAQGAPLFMAEPEGLRDVGGAVLHPYPIALQPQHVGLRGAFQLVNARLAVGCAMLLRQHGFAIEDAALAAGLATVTWPGRLEIVREAPLVVADGAHNGDSAEQLAAALREHFRFERLILILGTMADKDIAAIARALVPDAACVIVTQSRHGRSAGVQQVREAVAPWAHGHLMSAPGVDAALAMALRHARPGDMVCATGSLAVAAEAREYFGKGFHAP
jgi:dihydrofolate synthase/folylpolyglutamate synthase